MVATPPATDKVAAERIGSVVDAMRSIQSESDRWKLAERLHVLVPKGQAGFDPVIDAAKSEHVAGRYTVSTLRQYRDTAARWPASKRVADVSFSAHREAQPLIAADGNTDRAVKVLMDLAKQHGPDKVSVASVRQSVAQKQGKFKQPSKSKTNGAASVAQPALNVLKDLENGGPQLRAAITPQLELAQLDVLHAGTTKVLAHIEQLRSKAQAKAKRNAGGKSTPVAASPAAKKVVAKSPAKGGKVGDLRGL